MESLGALASHRLQKVSAVEAEIAHEQASALGITGRKLSQALAAFHRDREGSGAASRSQQGARIRERLTELMIQREALGLPHRNLEWILESYDIPPEVLEKLGLR